MKITIYELLGMVKDGKIPKKIKYDNDIWEYIEEKENYKKSNGASLNWDYVALYCLKEPVEILEEEKKIPEKLDLYEETQNIIRENNYKLVYHDIHKCIVSLECKYNQLLDYLKSKGDE